MFKHFIFAYALVKSPSALRASKPQFYINKFLSLPLPCFNYFKEFINWTLVFSFLFFSLTSYTDSIKLCNLTITTREKQWLILSFPRPHSACSVEAF